MWSQQVQKQSPKVRVSWNKKNHHIFYCLCRLVFWKIFCPCLTRDLTKCKVLSLFQVIPLCSLHILYCFVIARSILNSHPCPPLLSLLKKFLIFYVWKFVLIFVICSCVWRHYIISKKHVTCVNLIDHKVNNKVKCPRISE
jgi:hypothetical protein